MATAAQAIAPPPIATSFAMATGVAVGLGTGVVRTGPPAGAVLAGSSSTRHGGVALGSMCTLRGGRIQGGDAAGCATSRHVGGTSDAAGRLDRTLATSA